MLLLSAAPPQVDISSLLEVRKAVVALSCRPRVMQCCQLLFDPSRLACLVRDTTPLLTSHTSSFWRARTSGCILMYVDRTYCCMYVDLDHAVDRTRLSLIAVIRWTVHDDNGGQCMMTRQRWTLGHASCLMHPHVCAPLVIDRRSMLCLFTMMPVAVYEQAETCFTLAHATERTSG